MQPRVPDMVNMLILTETGEPRMTTSSLRAKTGRDVAYATAVADAAHHGFIPLDGPPRSIE